MEGVKQEPMKWFNKIFGNDDTALLRRSKMPSGDNITIPEKAFNLVNFAKATDYPYDSKAFGGLSQQAWTTIKESKFTPLELEYQIRVQAATTHKDKKEIEQLNAALETIANDSFVLDSTKANQFATELYQASLSPQETMTKEEAKALAFNPAALVEIKRRYFAMTLKPDGYFTRPGKNAFTSRVSMISDMLKQQQ
jgi:hypothetical protein